MLEAFSERQQELLYLLLRHKSGLTLDELAKALGIARTAVRQHVLILERDGYVAPGDQRATGGRPSRPYTLTDRGQAIFPKQYAWFSGVLLGAMQEEVGSEKLAEWLKRLAANVADSLQPQIPEPGAAAAVTLMNGLAYDAVLETTGDTEAIVAGNCVYHDLARDFPAVCDFDQVLIARLTGRSVHQTACMVKGDQVCRFQLNPPTDD